MPEPTAPQDRSEQSSLFGEDTRDKLQRMMDELYTNEIVVARATCGCVLGASVVPRSTNVSGMREHLRDVRRWQRAKDLRVETVNSADMPVTIGGCSLCRPGDTEQALQPDPVERT